MASTQVLAFAGAAVLGLTVTPVVLFTGAVQPAVASLCAPAATGWAPPVAAAVTVRFGQATGSGPATGIRYATPAGTVVGAVAAGTVTLVGGEVIEVTHPGQLVTRYTGVTTALRVGTAVTAGQPVGTTSHDVLTFTVLVGGTPVDPALYLADPTTGGGDVPDAATSAQAAVLAARAAAAAGFPRSELVTAVAVAGAESSWRPDASHLNRDGSVDYGLWQINSVHADLLAAGDWHDPADNAVMALKVWRMQGWGAWTTHDTGSYTRFLNVARMAVAQLADGDDDGSAPGAPGTPGAELASFNCGQGEASTGGRSTDTLTCTVGTDAGVDDGPDGARIRLCTVDGITVDVTLAPKLAQLLAAAATAGIDLGGSGYRSHARQIELRRAHCGPTAYDIWERPSRECSPPTAVPGKSMHEWGLAIDFTTRGAGTLTRSSAGFAWLSENAARFGLKNLPSEAWHWSTNGH